MGLEIADLLDPWKDLVVQIANSKDDGPVYARVREALEHVVRGGTGSNSEGPLDFPLPGLRVRVLSRRSVVVAASPPLPERASYVGFGLHRWDLDGQETQLQSIERELLATVLMMAKDPRVSPLRRCDWTGCRMFFFAKANHRREHSFCCDDHRRAYDLAHRDPAKVAAAMRRYRAEQARRRKTDRKRGQR
jgi:hypothetical protein